MKRKPLTRKQRVDLFDAHQGICHRCELKIHAECGERWHVGHVIALALGGKDSIENMAPEHEHCNMDDAHKNVTPKAAKGVRVRAKLLGVKKRQSKPLPGTYASGIRKKMDGTVLVERDGKWIPYTDAKGRLRADWRAK